MLVQKPCNVEVFKAYHWLDVGVWYSIELVELKLELRANVDVCAFVLSAVTVFWGRKDYMV